MALVLKRITNPYEAVKCSITKEWIMYPDYYYEDDEDGLIVDYDYYCEEKRRRRLEKAEPDVNRAMSSVEYRVMLKEKERQFMEKTLFDRPIFDNNRLKKDGDE